MEGFAEGYAVGQGNSNNNGGGFGGMWGNDWLALIVILALFGWGNNGNGGGFGGYAGGGCCNNFAGYEIGKLATTNDVASGFNNSAVLSSLNDIKLGQAQAINYNNQGFSGLSQVINSGFAGVDNAICNLGFNIQGGFNSLSREFADCCCQTQRAIDGVNYNMAKNTCDIQNTINNTTRDIIDSQRQGTSAILNFLTSEKISTLQAENSTLKAKLNNEHQTADIISALSPKAPIPAYPVFPATSFAYPTGVTFGCGGQSYNNNCGCGCGCGF